MDEKRKTKKIWIIAIIGILIVLLLPTSVSVPYQKLETYQESYTDKEDNQVEVPYEVTEPVVPQNWRGAKDAGVLSNTDRRIYGDGSLVNFSFDIYNDGEYGGFFIISVIGDSVYSGSPLRVPFDSIFPASDTVHCPCGTAISPNVIQPKSIGKIFLITDVSSISSNIHYYYLGIITDYETRTVTKYRIVTQNRDVIKTRPAQRYVTDYKEVNVLMFQRILGLY